MTDRYWERLLAKCAEVTQLGAAHPSAIFPDACLRSLLEDPVDGEEGYAPPAVGTRDLTLGEGADAFQIRVCTPGASEASGQARALVWVHGEGGRSEIWKAGRATRPPEKWPLEQMQWSSASTIGWRVP
jgi:hypothetical protein